MAQQPGTSPSFAKSDWRTIFGFAVNAHFFFRRQCARKQRSITIYTGLVLSATASTATAAVVRGAAQPKSPMLRTRGLPDAMVESQLGRLVEIGVLFPVAPEL